MRLKNINLPVFSLAFLLVGMPIIYITREYIPVSKTLFTHVITLILLLMMVNYKNLVNLKFYNNKPLIFILFLILNFSLFSLYAVTSGRIFENQESIFIVISIFIFFALSTHKSKIYENLYIYIIIISSLTTYISLALNTAEWILIGRFYVGDTFNPNLSSFIALINIMTIIYYLYIYDKISLLLKSILILTIILSAYIYIISFSKSAILGLVSVLVFLMFIDRKFINIFTKKIILFGIFFVITIPMFIPDIFQKIEDNIVLLQYAYESYIFGSKGNLSAEMRYDNLQKSFDALKNIDIFYGKGIYLTRADLPLLQVFTDLGIISGIINMLAMLLFPLIFLIKSILVVRTYRDDKLYNLYVFSIMFYLFYLPNSFFHGTPYEHTIWLPIFILYKFVPWRKKVNYAK